MLEKFKGAVLKDEVFYGLLVILVGVSSFGLGKLSSSDTFSSGHRQSAGIVLTTTGESDVVEGQDSIDEQPSEEAVYVGSKNGTKYHFPWCSGAQRILEENKIWFGSKEEATRAGYTPAGNCKGL